MTMTKPRHLHPVPDVPAPPPAAPAAEIQQVRTADMAVHRAARLAEAHDAATTAAFVPDVVTDQESAIARLMERLGAPGANLHALLKDFGRSMYVHGHMDAQASLEADVALAEIHSLDAARRRTAPAGGDPA